MGNLNMFKEKEKQACLIEGSYAGCHTRWRGLESPLSARMRIPLNFDNYAYFLFPTSKESL